MSVVAAGLYCTVDHAHVVWSCYVVVPGFQGSCARQLGHAPRGWCTRQHSLCQSGIGVKEVTAPSVELAFFASGPPARLVVASMARALGYLDRHIKV